jgi:hypothetical protein
LKWSRPSTATSHQALDNLQPSAFYLNDQLTPE